MSRPPGVFKNDINARNTWGNAYDAIPKSVFAVAAWHLANLASGEIDQGGAAERQFLSEVEALHDNGLITSAQATAALKAVQALLATL